MIDKLECDYGICKHEVFQDNKCIFHCDKEDNEKWGKPTKYVKKFWEELLIHIKKEEEDSTKDAILLTHYRFPCSPSNINQININKDLNIQSCIFLYKMTFLRVNFLKDVSFFKNKFLKKFGFNSCEIHQKLIFNWQNNDEEEKKEEDYSFKGLIFDGCEFIENANIEFFNADINQLVFLNNTNNAKKFLLTNVSIHEELYLKSMSLKEFDFNNVDLSKAMCNFQHLSFDGVVFSKIKWGKNLQTRFYIDDKKVKKADREIARQIKHTYDTQGDKINANKFHALEKALYKDELEEVNDASLQDKIIFNIENIVSQHGQNFLLPLFWIFFFGSMFTFFKSLDLENSFLLIIPIVFITIYNIDFDKLYYKICFYSLSAIMILYVLYFKLDCFFEMIDITKGSEPIDFIFKILFLFLSYQLVMVVRKDTRR